LAIFHQKEKLKTKKSENEVILEVFSRQSDFGDFNIFDFQKHD
jgi:hypothetical protein